MYLTYYHPQPFLLDSTILIRVTIAYSHAKLEADEQ